MSLFASLPTNVKNDIANLKFDCNADELGELYLKELSFYSADELFDMFLTYNGIIGYSYVIHQAHEACYKKEV